MSFKRNVIANYVSQLYSTLIAIAMVPLYVRYMGAEAYGLVGFFAMLQMWFQLLDMGITATITRETARFHGGAGDALSLRRLLCALEMIFFGIALVGAMALMASAGVIASSWLKVQQLPLTEVRNAIMLMATIVALRWICGLYRGAITGFERFVWLSGFNSAVATTRFVLVIPFFIYVGASPTEFFSFQLVVAIAETAALMLKTYRLLPRIADGQRLLWQWASLRGVLGFSLSIAFTNSIWVIVTQTDKLLLSKLLPLTDYAYFTLAVLVASGVLVISSPISGALLPRLTKLSAEGDDAGLIRLYRNATQVVGVIAIPPALMLAFFAEQVLWAWTGDADIARKAAPVLSLYALGNGVLALGAFPYYLQFAKGDLKLHLIGNALFVVLLIPAMVWATWRYGIVGAGYAWLCANVVFFLLYVPTVHARFVKGLHLQWLLRDVSVVVLLSVMGCVMLHGLMKWPQEREAVAIGIVVAGLMLLSIAAAGSSWVRTAIGGRYRARFFS
ncbi:polysaccharide biosynthesis protein [Noviherbaspirillum cavernae]|uniref:Polysaccharide biosynthesis protein n=1 Tax=Noviherbaspirillum cavernae TaxID=2320862 RepID=A0A418X640_9BURK|nr:polysaccharide biosynthesis protein [Noviherbaspirillum cavernae]